MRVGHVTLSVKMIARDQNLFQFHFSNVSYGVFYDFLSLFKANTVDGCLVVLLHQSPSVSSVTLPPIPSEHLPCTY